MRKHVLLYGLIGGVLVAILKFIEYRWLVVSHSLELYGGLVALVFVVLGIWLGRRLTGRTETVVVREVEVREVVVREVEVREVEVTQSTPFICDEKKREALAITPREMEILQRIAEGLSNKEIAARLFVSENTVKTHSSRLFEKLAAKRRTQAVQIAKAVGLIP